MTKTKSVLQRLSSEDGASMVEYALVVILIAIVALFAVAATGTEVDNLFDQIAPAFTPN